jgi:hypothetical protein
MAITTQDIAKFYLSESFLSFYSPQYRLKQIQLALKDKRTSAAERLQWVKYLDAHVGDVPEKGEGSGVTTVKFVGFDGLKSG